MVVMAIGIPQIAVQQADAAQTTAMWSALSAIVAVLATQAVKAVVVWLRGRGEVDGKKAATAGRMALSDREQLTRFIEDMRKEQERTDARLDDALARMNAMSKEDAQLKSDIAVAQRDLMHATEQHDRDREEWLKEREFLLGEIKLLKAQVEQLQRQRQRKE